MSHRTYNNLWAQAQRTLEDVTQIDVILQTAKPQRDKRAAQQIVSELYVKYVLIVNKLGQCYDQILQPQKRLIIRKLLDASIGRMLEIKHELVNLEMSEFSYHDQVLTNMGLLPQDIDICIPKYYRRERHNILQQRQRTMDDILRKLGFYEEEIQEELMTEVEAVRIIQVHERARQGRIRAQFMKEIRLLKEKGKPESLNELQSNNSIAAALSIQKTWRGHMARRKVQRRKFEEMQLIGMIRPTYLCHDERYHAEEVAEMRRQLQEQYEKEYEKTVTFEKELCKKNQGGKMMEDMADTIRTWYTEFKQQAGKFPDFPSEEAGGSSQIFRSSSRQGTESSMSKSTAGSSAGKIKKDKGKSKSSKEDLSKKADEDDEDPGFKMCSSNFLTDLLTANLEFETVWRSKLNDMNEKPYIEMIKAEKQSEIEGELRKIVDKMLREELEMLQMAFDRDRAKKGKKIKRSGKKKGRRGGKKSKKKKEKDLTPDRTTESLFEELVTNGIIRKFPEVSLSSFCGQQSYANFDLRQQGKDPISALGDIRQVLTEFCILPLGSKTIHQNSPLVRSLLLAGPAKSGKDMLVHAICSETGSLLFDLSPSNIVGKYPGKSGLIMLVHLVTKVARLLQPAVIFMNEAEKPFMKKVPKTDKTDPKRLKKDLPKIVKGIGPDDQIMLIGLSSAPWDCDQKSLQQTYSKFILIPKPDYASLHSLWTDLLFEYPGVSRQFDIGSVAKLSQGYTVGSIKDVVKEVMNCKRILQLIVQPLSHLELINTLSRRQPIWKEEEEAFLVWFSKTPIGRRKARYLEMLAEKQMLNQNQKSK